MRKFEQFAGKQWFHELPAGTQSRIVATHWLETSQAYKTAQSGKASALIDAAARFVLARNNGLRISVAKAERDALVQAAIDLLMQADDLAVPVFNILVDENIGITEEDPRGPREPALDPDPSDRAYYWKTI